MSLFVLGSLALAAVDKYTFEVPNGLSFAEFRGYEAWQLVSLSDNGSGLLVSTLANPVMIQAYLAGVLGNGKPFPDGAKMAKIHWKPKKFATSQWGLQARDLLPAL